MKFEPWRLESRIIDVSDDDGNRIGLIHNPHSELSSFFTPGKGSEIELAEMREILKRMEPQANVESNNMCAWGGICQNLRACMEEQCCLNPAEPHVEGEK